MGTEYFWKFDYGADGLWALGFVLSAGQYAFQVGPLYISWEYKHILETGEIE